VRERRVRPVFPGFFEDRRRALGLAFANQQPRRQRGRRSKRRRHAERLLRHLSGFVGAALTLELLRLRRHQHGAAALGDLVFDLLALVAGIQRLDRVFPIALLYGEIECVLERPRRGLRRFQRRFRMRARRNPIAALQCCRHQTFAAENFSVFVL
jgi:hypothetical protein